MMATITIHSPRIESDSLKTRIVADVEYDNHTVPVWFEVDAKYGEFLCCERSDAFLIGVLNFAMRKQYDIVCEAPVGARLLYQIREYMIPMLSKYGRDMYATRISSPVAEKRIETAGAVGAGISCGVDSLNVVKNCSVNLPKGLKLTHLVINNVGAFGLVKKQYEWQTNHAREFCKEYGFELIETDSNFTEAVPQNHSFTHTFSSCFAIFCLQKLWSVYYYGSSGNDFQESFNLLDNDIDDSARYELLSFYAFSTDTLELYSEGGAYTRFEKLKNIIDYPPAHKYLHVCASNSGPNCCVCNKCCRTLVTLDALGALDKFSKVFDIAYYRSHRKWYLKWLYRQQVTHGDTMVGDAYLTLKKDITFLMKISVLCEVFNDVLCDAYKIQMSKSHRMMNQVKLRIIRALPAQYRWYRKFVRHYAD